MKPSFPPTFSPTEFPTTTTSTPTRTPVQKLDIGDKVEVIQHSKEEPQMGCVMALPDGEGEGKWTVALEDPDAGTYLFHMPAPPKLVESAGCLLDAMGEDSKQAQYTSSTQREESD